MPRFLIELKHEDEHDACVRALRAIEKYGSHFVTRSDWGCKAGVHSGWFIGDFDSRDEVMQMVPPEYREDARIVQLNRFTREEITSLIADFEG